MLWQACILALESRMKFSFSSLLVSPGLNPALLLKRMRSSEHHLAPPDCAGIVAFVRVVGCINWHAFGSPRVILRIRRSSDRACAFMDDAAQFSLRRNGSFRPAHSVAAFALLVVAGLIPGPASCQTMRADAAAPHHDISGTWEPANSPGDGIQPIGAKAMPNDGKPEHQLPYTPLGLATLKSHKADEGADAVLPGYSTDPRNKCEPVGMPRADLSNFRQTQILQNEYKVVILYEYAETWRVVWIDGRELPKVVDGGVQVGKEIREPRYYGYSVGKWVDDTTLLVQTVGTMGEDRTWVDLAGRPVSDALRVEERFHRVNHDRLELTVTIDDPEMYTKPWVAMDRFPMKLQDPHTDVMELYCSPTEMERFNKLIGDPVSDSQNKKPNP